MKMPRDLTGAELAKALRSLGYIVTRQKGSHMRITTMQDGEHHEVIPHHVPIKVGTLHSILKSIAGHHDKTVEALLNFPDL